MNFLTGFTALVGSALGFSQAALSAGFGQVSAVIWGLTELLSIIEKIRILKLIRIVNTNVLSNEDVLPDEGESDSE